MRDLAVNFREALPARVDFATIRFVEERTEVMMVRKNNLQPMESQFDRGAMVTILHGGGMGYAATADLSVEGLRQAALRALAWAEASSKHLIFDAHKFRPVPQKGSYAGPRARRWEEVSLAERIELLQRVCAELHIDPRIVEWSASVLSTSVFSRLLSTDGMDIEQSFSFLSPEIEVYAHENGDTQRRTLGGLRGTSQQGGMDVLDRFAFGSKARHVAEQALELLAAPECPNESTELVLAPDQMLLQIHESIGHPLEMDRILGDERNYAGTSFVTQDMFGSYRYGSDLLNITFDPEYKEQFASYGYDDDGSVSKKTYLIEKGILKNPLGGALSGFRSGLSSVANVRASGWNRPPIDRMANLNLEPGETPFLDLLAKIERGVYMETNKSWSIDDSRNKFQFGCEYAREIKDGKLGRVLKNPNYRGVSASFWRDLAGVGSREDFQILGTPFCGKGEPNQVIRVGHASPPCWFRNVEVFGGGE